MIAAIPRRNRDFYNFLLEVFSQNLLYVVEERHVHQLEMSWLSLKVLNSWGGGHEESQGVTGNRLLARKVNVFLH